MSDLSKDLTPEQLLKLRPKPDGWDEVVKRPVRKDYCKFVADLVSAKTGTLVECGVGPGVSLSCFAELMPETTMWGFDSFEGLPDPAPVDKFSAKIKKGYLSQYTYKKALKVFEKYPNVRLVKGFFDKTLDQYDGGPIAVLHLDCDIYPSYKVCLEKLWDKVEIGGVVMFDEYYREFWTHGKFPGGVVAIDEFLADKDQEIRHFPDFGGKSYLVKR